MYNTKKEKDKTMKEIKREFAMFGNFDKIDFNYVISLKEKLSNFGFSKIDGIQELKIINQQNNKQPVTRPQLSTNENELSIYFGSSRINIDQFKTDTNIDEFIYMVKEFVNIIFKDSEISVNRLALNANLQFSPDESQKVIKKFFNTSELYPTIDEVSFLINSVEHKEELKNKVNKIFSFQKINNNMDGAFDYNTFVLNDRKYTIDDATNFINLAVQYREAFFNEFN